MGEVLNLNAIKKKMLLKYPAFGSTINTVKYEIVKHNHLVTTAATDGKTIFVNAKYMSKLSEQEQIFVFAHEVCHIALNHIMRSKGKDLYIWNIATDAVINQHLQKDGLPIIKDGVKIENALEYDAEELYEILLKNQDNQKQKQSQNKQGNQSNQSNQQGEKPEEQQDDKGQGGYGDNKQKSKNANEVGHDSHSMWEEAIKKSKQEQFKSKYENFKQNKKPQRISEKDAFELNSQTKIKRAEEIMSELNTRRRGFGGNSEEVLIGNVGTAKKQVTNWKKLLSKNLQIEDETWGHKFSDSSNGYRARIEDIEYDEQAISEIILDTSGSVSIDLLKSFLRQVKTLLKNSEIRVGTFSSEFHGWIEIKKEKDIDNLKLSIGGGTNFNAASEAFTKRKDVNKICFTDGDDNGDAKILNKRKDIVWISFENPDFKPDNGKVIFVPKDIINLQTNYEQELTM